MRIGFVSDIHEDITRLKEAFVILKKQKCEKIICLGDFIGYSVPYYGYLSSRNASEVINLIKINCESIVVGNHDLFSIRKVPKYKAGIQYKKNWYSLDYQTRKKLSKNKIFLYEEHDLSPLINSEDKKFIEKLPEYVVKKYGDKKILFSHCAFPDLIGTTVFEPKTPKDVKKHFDFMKKHKCNLSISGHDHKEGIMIFTEKEVREIPFNKKIKLKDEPTWLHGPSVANGTFANGVLCLDTEKMEIVAIPLKTKKHVPPKWKNL
ncbi:MAG: metallophosphoesterase [Candidatus Nanoarchaeia archaeon]|nr:metallophosphoesterase [Candidatus Nanoarchaeia archaeon]